MTVHADPPPLAGLMFAGLLVWFLWSMGRAAYRALHDRRDRMPKGSKIQKAIADIDGQIAKLQETKALLLKYTSTPEKPKAPRARKAVEPAIPEGTV